MFRIMDGKGDDLGRDGHDLFQNHYFLAWVLKVQYAPSLQRSVIRTLNPRSHVSHIRLSNSHPVSKDAACDGSLHSLVKVAISFTILSETMFYRYFPVPRYTDKYESNLTLTCLTYILHALYP